MKKYILFFVCIGSINSIYARKNKSFTLLSPDNKLSVTINTAEKLTWSVMQEQQTITIPSAISITLNTGEVLGKNVQINSSDNKSVNETFNTVAYKKDKVENNYNQLTLICKGDYGIIFRAYNDGAAYRFFTKKKGELIIESEEAEFNFDRDYKAFIPLITDVRGGEKYSCSFEEFYEQKPVSQFNKDSLGFLPFLIESGNNKKAVVLEADVQDYPGMFVLPNKNVAYGLKATFAPYPLEEALGGYNKFNYMANKRAEYIAKVNGTRNFPWRIIVVSKQDRDLLNSDMVQKLSEVNKIENTSWIKPGKVAWDWWNDWNISHVDFKAGVNTASYKYYIDFASANHIEYVVLDEGWSDAWDLNKLNPDVDLTGLIAYAKQKNVGLILWSTWYALSRDAEGLCSKYAAMGVKGFKVDFLDRNDQKMTSSCYQMASIAAKYKMMLDFHGMFPPQGLQRTWPNVINFEGVRGMEYMKWSADDRVPKHEVSLPFIRMMAGPMDYTPGAMRNATRGNAKPNNALPMSMGTRCHQMAIYIAYEGPLQMLADNPTIYMKEQECTDFISKIPTTFNETIALDGKLGEYVAIARRKDNTWYVSAMTNWDERDVDIDLSFLSNGKYEGEIFTDGINADRNATDYAREVTPLNPTQKLKIHLAPGGGFAMRISKL